MVYDDATGKVLKKGDVVQGTPSFGIGHNGHNPLSLKVMNLIQDEDIATVAQGLDRSIPWWRTLNDVRQEALLNMAFNLGVAGLLEFKDMLAALEVGNYQVAYDEIHDSLWIKQVGFRAARIAKELRDGAV